MEKGGQSLTDSTQAISRLMDAQKAEYWSGEEGFQAMRRSLISYLRTEKDVVSNQMVRFEKFDGDVDTAVSAFEAAYRGTVIPCEPGALADRGRRNSVVWKCERRHEHGCRWQWLRCRYESHAERAV